MRRKRSDPDLRHLRYVKAERRDDLRLFPDFLIVGPQRTGTTWLHRNLQCHPQVFLTSPKEIYFFNSLLNRQNGKFQSDRLSWYLEHFREPWKRRLKKSLRCMHQFGEFYSVKARGEATASYAALPDQMIQEITVLNPEIRVIIMVRNPIDRVWSDFKKWVVRDGGHDGQLTDEKSLLDFVRSDYQMRCAQYMQNIANWTSHTKRGHVFVGFFDDLKTHPTEFLLEVMAFLGVKSARKYVAEQSRQKINPSKAVSIPDRLRDSLSALLADEIARLKNELGVSWSTDGNAFSFIPTDRDDVRLPGYHLC